jgi:hypothetical protein
MHDHGSLPQLKTTGHYTEVLASLQLFKKEIDRVLTRVISESNLPLNSIEDEADIENEVEEELSLKKKRIR